MPVPPDVADCVPRSELTSREIDVLAALARGLDTAAIATELGLSPRTVRNYLSRSYDKLGVSNRVQASLWALENLSSSPDTARRETEAGEAGAGVQP